MKHTRTTNLINRVGTVLFNSDGTSIVLVTIISIIIIAGVIILRTTTSSLWASADKQYSQDQSYEMATSLGNSLDALINNDKVPLADIAVNGDGVLVAKTDDTGLPNSSIEARVSRDDASGFFIVRVESHVAHATYIYTARYSGAGYSYTRIY